MFCVSGYSQNKHIHIKAEYALSIFKKQKYVGVLNVIISTIAVPARGAGGQLSPKFLRFEQN